MHYKSNSFFNCIIAFFSNLDTWAWLIPNSCAISFCVKSKKYLLQEIIDRNYNIDLCGFPHEEEEILAPKELIQQYQEKRSSLNADIDRILEQVTTILGIELETQD